VNTRFSKLEVKQLGISILIMALAIAYDKSFYRTLWLFPISLLIIAPAFALHEVGHKLAAQKLGYAAEYRMWTKGLALALLMAVATTWLAGSKFLFIAPGAVYFSRRQALGGSVEDLGRIGFAGPLVNLGLVAFFGLVSIFSTNALLFSIASVSVYVNAFLALFNLIPFGPLDGQKILNWNKMIWVISLAIALISLFFSGGLAGF